MCWGMQSGSGVARALGFPLLLAWCCSGGTEKMDACVLCFTHYIAQIYPALLYLLCSLCMNGPRVLPACAHGRWGRGDGAVLGGGAMSADGHALLVMGAVNCLVCVLRPLFASQGKVCMSGCC